MPVKHLLKHLEDFKSNRNNRDVRPLWVTQFVNDAAELFEPLDDVGRVGFNCQLTDDCWKVSLYLGSHEIVGGRDDGQSRYSNFHFDLNGLINRFRSVDRMQITAFSTSETDEESGELRAMVEVSGEYEGNPLLVCVHSIPPEGAGPGLRRYIDGRCEPV